jgi:predicted nucleotidyltransferase
VSEQLALEVDPPQEVELLRDKLGAEWPAIMDARERADEMLQRLRGVLEDFLPDGTTFVVYGSLARRELTQGSDVDWTLLVDAAASRRHQELVGEVRRRLKRLGLAEPTATGSFGRLTFSHDLIHKIGGDDDSNRNTTQRILLLLESVAIANPGVHASVVDGVLRRYIEEDLQGPGDSPFRVPRFLQNDIARYWRTMAVDFAHKRRERSGSGWALRTAKLRLSRKLIYATGLLNCFSCKYELSPERYPDALTATERVVAHLAELVRKTPLDIVARTVLLFFGELSGSARELFDAYNEFLGFLDDESNREHLEQLRSDRAPGDRVYEDVRQLGERFQHALTTMFFDSATPISDLTKRYGVF